MLWELLSALFKVKSILTLLSIPPLNIHFHTQVTADALPSSTLPTHTPKTFTNLVDVSSVGGGLEVRSDSDTRIRKLPQLPARRRSDSQNG